MKNRKLGIALLTILLVLFLDQWLKIYVKTNFHYNEERPILGTWFSLLFVENRGMAFGWELPFFGKDTAKILLSLFRVVAVAAIAYYLYQLVKKKVSSGLIVSIALIFSGAMGNILDSAFYGLIFTDSARAMGAVATTVPWGEGYASFLTGHVVDMLRFDLFTVDLPFYGSFNFFAPIFNLADFAISLGVGIILLFQRKSFQENFFSKEGDQQEQDPESEAVSAEEDRPIEANEKNSAIS